MQSSVGASLRPSQEQVHGVWMGEVDVTEGAPLVDPSLQSPGWIQLNFNESVAIPPGNRGAADHDGSSLARVEDLQLQAVAPLPQAQPEAAAKVFTTAAK